MRFNWLQLMAHNDTRHGCNSRNFQFAATHLACRRSQAAAALPQGRRDRAPRRARRPRRCPISAWQRPHRFRCRVGAGPSKYALQEAAEGP